MTSNQHTLYGKHSGIPDCCIKFFITNWPQLLIKVGHARHRDPIAEYVRCPSCLATNRLVQIHYCNNLCNDFHRQIKIGKYHETNELPFEVEYNGKH